MSLQLLAVPIQCGNRSSRNRTHNRRSRTIPYSATLDEKANYQEILTVIQHTGQQFERLPRTYADKDEEALRDHLILVLEPNFEYSTSGETFNKGGKTDILVRYEKANVLSQSASFGAVQITWRAHLSTFVLLDLARFQTAESTSWTQRKWLHP